MADASWLTSKTGLSCRYIFSCESAKLLGIFLNPRPEFLKEILGQIRPVLPLHFCDESQLVVPSQNHPADYFVSHSVHSTLKPDNKLPWQIVVRVLRTHIYIKLRCVRSGLLQHHLLNSYRHGYRKMTSSYWNWYPELTQWGTLPFI